MRYHQLSSFETVRSTGEPETVCHIFGIGEKDKYIAPADVDYGAWDYARSGGVSQNSYQQAGNAAQRRQAAPIFNQTARVDDTQDSQSRGAQQAALGMYQQAASGQGPSMAGAQMQQGIDAAASQQMSMARSAGGSGLQRAAAQRAAMQNASQLGSQNAAAAAGLKAQEQQAGMAGMAGIAGQMRGGDQALQAARMQAVGLNNQSNLSVAELRMRQSAMNDAQQQFFVNHAQGVSNSQFGANMDAQKTMSSNYNNAQGLNSGVYMDDMKRGDAAASGAIAAGAKVAGAAVAMSDRRLKEHIEPADGAVMRALEGLRPYAFDYKDEKHGDKRQLGVMAQDLERTKLGGAVVEETPEGKGLDQGKALGLTLAGLAALSRRLDRIEGKK